MAIPHATNPYPHQVPADIGDEIMTYYTLDTE